MGDYANVIIGSEDTRIVEQLLEHFDSECTADELLRNDGVLCGIDVYSLCLKWRPVDDVLEVLLDIDKWFEKDNEYYHNAWFYVDYEGRSICQGFVNPDSGIICCMRDGDLTVYRPEKAVAPKSGRSKKIANPLIERVNK